MVTELARSRAFASGGSKRIAGLFSSSMVVWSWTADSRVVVQRGQRSWSMPCSEGRACGLERTVTLDKARDWAAVESGKTVVIWPLWLFLRAHTVR